MIIFILPVSFASPHKGKQKGVDFRHLYPDAPQGSQNQPLHGKLTNSPLSPPPSLFASLIVSLFPDKGITIQIIAQIMAWELCTPFSLTPHLPVCSCFPPLNRCLLDTWDVPGLGLTGKWGQCGSRPKELVTSYNLIAWSWQCENLQQTRCHEK